MPLPGALRLQAARRIARFATQLVVSRSAGGTTAWRSTYPGGSLTLMLTAGAWRGFSGEGSLLVHLAHPEAEAAGRQLTQHLAWQPLLDPVDLVTATGLERPGMRSDAGLAWLSASGRLGYDLRRDAVRLTAICLDPHAAARRPVWSACGPVDNWCRTFVESRLQGRHVRRPAARGEVVVHLCLGARASRRPRAMQARVGRAPHTLTLVRSAGRATKRPIGRE